MVRNRRAAARAVAIQQESAAQAAAGWLFVIAGLAAVTALASALSFIAGGGCRPGLAQQSCARRRDP